MNEEKKAVTLMTPGQERFGRWMIKYVARLQVLVYRLSKGKFLNTFNGGAVVLVEMRQRDTGKFQTLPLVYAQDGENVLIAASLGGMSRHPNWYHNLVACPRVVIQIGAERRKVLAREVESQEEADAVWAKLDEAYPDFAEYRERATLSARRIPLFVLEPRTE